MSWNKQQRERGDTGSERAGSRGRQILRCAQDDRTALDDRIELDDRTALGRYNSESVLGAMMQMNKLLW